MTHASTPKIAVRGLGKHFITRERAFHALDAIDLDVRPNEFLALVGASGCGKSTLLRIIGGLETLTEGEIRIDGQPIHGPGKDRVMVFQDYSLYPWLTVIENIRFCRQLDAHVRDASTADAASAVDRSYALLALMGLEKVKNSYPNALSGGMRQRVAIARALMSRPEVLLMDEPFGALDAQTREVMHDLILHVFELEKTTIVFVTHDVDEAIYLADRVVVLAPNPGHVDSIYDIDLPPPLERNQDLKLAPDFLAQKKTILDRIRQTTGVQRDLEMLERMTRHLRNTAQTNQGD
ncbi:sulfonate ABC transporter ATP-binding protein [Acidihalobacter yilgarnensis]|uniref:Sulfonate ABC transporter ATP-binding protein n=1 Tax=Acidihalobacter yilgarnensis TaxID=2819280 RepID=A0A1D8IRW8_9GAMM|nr:ABC transporter ATP-binding protein [Acidihalobacter yilgarnensis]AOU99147.1 sulfonate ABC transporter ATP-binding protein [Acidihalobacter yilgarnensis]